MSVAWLDETDPPDAFPDVESALDQPDGLLAAGGDLSPARLVAAYRRGIFPWYEAGQPILWWSPDPRMVIFPNQLHVSRRLRRTLRNTTLTLTADTSFAKVIGACAQPRSYGPGTWITPEMASAYVELHRRGHAHSFEIWEKTRLVGGVYGVALGKVFFGESMFSAVRDASKIALVHMVQFLSANGFELVDGQVDSPHLRSLGATVIARTTFTDLVRDWCDQDTSLPDHWSAQFEAFEDTFLVPESTT